jgi:hypothetical protein
MTFERRNLGATADAEGQLVSRSFLATDAVVGLRGILGPGERREEGT